MKTDTTQQNIPNGWKFGELGNFLADIGDGGTPSRSKDEYFGGNIPWVVVNDIKPHIKQTKDTLTDEGFQKSSAKLWPAGSVILSFGATIGEVGIADVPVTTKQGIAGVIPNDDLLNTYLYYVLLSKKNLLHKLSSGSTIKEVRPSVIKNQIEVLIPPIKEQQKIAEILGTVDEDITKTQKVIEATEKLKRGLMQQLFTQGLKGIVSDTVPLGKVAKVQGGYSFSSSDFSDSGVPVIRISNIKDGYIKLDGVKYYPKEITKRLEGFSLEKDDVVIAMSGATTGKIGIVKEVDLPLLMNQRVGRFMPSADIDGKYLYNIVISEFYQKRIWDFAIGGAQPNVSGPQLESIEIPLPGMSEQKQIAEILSAVDEKIAVNKKLKAKLTLLKKGLMQDLLSGKVRAITN